MRFLLDEDLNPAVAEIGRGLDLEVVSVHEIDRRGFGDREQLRFSVSDGRTFVTRNRDDFIRLTIELFQTAEAHFGVLIVPHSLPNDQPRRIAHSLRRWHNQHADLGEAVHYLIDFLTA